MTASAAQRFPTKAAIRKWLAQFADDAHPCKRRNCPIGQMLGVSTGHAWLLAADRTGRLGWQNRFIEGVDSVNAAFHSSRPINSWRDLTAADIRRILEQA